MTVLRSILLLAVAALAEIGGAWLVWQGVREHRGLAFVGGGVRGLLAQVSQQDVLAGADPPGDGLANRPGSDDDIDLAHGELLGRSCGCIACLPPVAG
jgi:hypothetical protein